ncbi:Hypothetical predicted protein [Mytilus galloprovincialis]|nr:Hypothetical predicted protein [Mytilus galloprovincialis]
METLQSLKVDSVPVPIFRGHPNGHKLRFTQGGRSPYGLERSKSFGVPFAREASFEIERPQGNSKYVINIPTSFVRKQRTGTKYSEQSFSRGTTSLPNISSPSPRTQFSKPVKQTSKITVIEGESYVRASFRKPAALRPATPMNLSTEKERWIANWIEKTNKALDGCETPLPVISE